MIKHKQWSNHKMNDTSIKEDAQSYMIKRICEVPKEFKKFMGLPTN